MYARGDAARRDDFGDLAGALGGARMAWRAVADRMISVAAGARALAPAQRRDAFAEQGWVCADGLRPVAEAELLLVAGGLLVG
jgi:hypothetical protein